MKRPIRTLLDLFIRILSRLSGQNLVPKESHFKNGTFAYFIVKAMVCCGLFMTFLIPKIEAQIGCNTTPLNVTAEFDDQSPPGVTVYQFTVNETATSATDQSTYHAIWPDPSGNGTYSDFTNPLGSSQSDSIFCVTTSDASNEGPDIVLDIIIPPYARYECGDISFTLCRVGDFNGENEAVWIVNKEIMDVNPNDPNLIMACIPGTGGSECQGYGAVNCIDVVTRGTALTNEFADGMFSIALITAGGDPTSNSADHSDANCADPNETGNCFRLSNFSFPIIYPPVIEAISVPDLCGSDMGLATSSMLEGTAPFTYEWAVVSGNVTLGPNGMPDIEVTPTGSGNYELSLLVSTGDGNCTDFITLEGTVDGDPPTITCPSAVTISKDADCMYDLSGLADATATDLAGTTTVSSIDDLSGLTGCAGTGTIIRTWTATDECMNTSSCTQTITIEDTTAPTISCPSSMTVYMDANCSYTADPAMTGTPMTSDNCAGETYDYSDNTGGLNGCGGSGTIIRTWTATDACGNSSSCDQNIIVEDAMSPEISCPQTLVLEVGDSNNDNAISAWLTTASGTDNCGAVTISDDYDPNNFVNICGAAEQQMVTFTATDACGNTTTCMAMITIGDMTPPDITCPSDLALECGDPNNASLIDTWLASLVASDPGGGAVTTDNSYDANAFTDGCGLSGEQEVTFTATDDCMMMNMCTATITIVDTTSPVINCPSAVTIDLNGICMFDSSPMSTGDATGSDDCNMNPIMFSFDDNLSGLTGCGGTGVIIRTWTGIDDCNNSSSCDQNITVQDITEPMISCPADIIIYMDADCNFNSASAITGEPAVTDNCPDATFSFVDDNAGLNQCSGTGAIARTWTAVDDCGNASECIQTINVEDDSAPSITCPPTLTLEVGDATNESMISSWLSTIISSDNCGVTTSHNYDSNNFINICGASEEQLVTFTAMDDCLNTSSCTATIFIGDTTPPSITCPGDLTIECALDNSPGIEELDNNADPTNGSLIVAWLASVTSSDIGGAAITIGNSFDANGYTDGCGMTGEQEITFTATDECMLMTSCTATITIVDNTPPIVECPPAMTIDLDGMCTYDTSPTTIGEPTGTDDCNMNPVMFVFNDDISGLTGCGGTGLIVRTWTGADECGNSSTCTQDITVQDVSAPEITCPADATIQMDANCNYNADPGITGDPAVTDNCAGASFSYVDDPSGLDQCGGTGVIVRTWTSEDACGNTSECAQNIYVEDNEAPIITGIQNIKASCDDDMQALFDDWIANNGYGTATDNCNTVIWTTIPAMPVFNVSPAVNEVTFVATDACGNESTHDAIFSVACLGVAKAIGDVSEAASGTNGNYDVTFSIVMKNNGSVDLDNLNLQDILDDPSQIGSAFIGVVTAPTFSGGTATTFPNINSGYTGTAANSYLFDGTSGLLLPGEDLVVTFVIEVDPNAPGAPDPMQNQATGTADDPDGDTAEDDSDSGPDPDGDNPDHPGDTGGEDDPTPLILPAVSALKTFVSYEESLSGLSSHFDIVMDISMKNIGNVPLTNIDLFDDLSDPNNFSIYFFGLAPGIPPVIISSTATTDPNISNSYTGFTANSNIFDGTSGILEQSQELTVRIRLELDASLGGLPDTLFNSATAGGDASDPDGNVYTDENGDPYYTDDDSDSGSDFEGDNPGEPGDNGTEDDPTPVPLLGGIDSHVWKDLDGDGVRAAGEPGIEQIKVYLFDCDGTIVDSTLTDVTGNYVFDLVFPGDYYIEFDYSNQPPACIVTFQDQGGDDSVDSDANSDGVIPCFPLTAAETKEDLDLGLLMLPCIGNFVWHDLNGNGQQDSGEPGLEGLMVYLYEADGTLVNMTTTDANGNYLFEFLYQGDFYLKFEVPALYDLATGPNQGNDTELDSDVDNSNGPNTTPVFTLNWGQCDLSWDAGFYTCVPLGEIVWYDVNKNDIRDDIENGINGIEITLFRKVNGNWKFYDSQVTGHKAGTISDDGYFKFCPIPGEYFAYLNIQANGLVPVRPFQGNDNTKDSELTGANGEYTTSSFDLICGEERCDMGFGFYPMASIGDLVWMDDNADGVRQANEDMAEGVVIEAFDMYNDLIGVDTTDQNGMYMIDYLEKEGYFIKINPPSGYNLTSNNMGTDGSIDSDFDHSNGDNTTPYFMMTPGVHMPNIDAGLVGGVALPTELLSFTGQYRPDYIYLSWATAAEINTEYFEVERRHESEDDFVSIGRQITKGSDSKYNMNDYDVAKDGVYYYRLRSIDTDGSKQLSEVVSVDVRRDRADGVSIYPNPAVSNVNIELSLSSPKQVNIDIYDTQGKLMRANAFGGTLDAGTMNTVIDVKDIPVGVYNLQIQLGDELLTRRLILLKN